MLSSPPDLSSVIASALLILSQTSSASPLLSSLPNLFSRDGDQCYQSNYTPCSGSDLPSYFCCGEGYDCITLAGDTSVLCCPEDATQNCIAVEPMGCITDWDEYLQGEGNEFFTTATDQDLPACGSQCCPFGYSCGTNGDGSDICIKDDNQSVEPGSVVAESEPTTTQSSGSGSVVIVTSYTQGSYPTNAGAHYTPASKDDNQGGDGNEHKRAGIIVGATVGGFASVAGLFVFLLIACRRRRRSRSTAAVMHNPSSFRSFGQDPRAASKAPAFYPPTRTGTTRSTNTEAVEEKYGIRVHEFSPPPPPPPPHDSVPPRPAQMSLPPLPKPPSRTSSSRTRSRVAPPPHAAVMTSPPPITDADALSPTSPIVTEYSKPARVFRKDTVRKDRKITVLNILTKLPLPAPAELPASPVSVRYLSPDGSPGQTPGQTPIQKENGLTKPPLSRDTRDENKEYAQENGVLEIPRGRKSMTPSIKTFGRNISVSPAPGRAPSPLRPKSSQSNKYQRPKTLEGAYIVRSKSYGKPSFSESVRKSTASLIPPILTANFASSPRTPPPVPEMPGHYRSHYQAQAQAQRPPPAPQLPPPGAGLRPPTSAVSPHPPVILAVDSSEDLGVPSPVGQKTPTPPLEQEQDGCLPEVVAGEMTKEFLPDPASRSLWRPSSGSHLSARSAGNGSRQGGGRSGGSANGHVNGNGNGFGKRGASVQGEGLIGKNR
ncbi:uncharacterized protein MKZ38_008953 [Zalerion maritima]|uniref:Uncharacterized protein n=1 Tax=Zalerion maritima TaxID=339359 RepID=A0AAD5RTR7_9PEZI|nr:uncharacterized protein MKZ38_008953 [Zalerion maritima]